MYEHREFDAAIESAIRVTNNNDVAVAVGLAAAKLLRAAIEYADIDRVLELASTIDRDPVAALVKQANSKPDQTTPAATLEWGMACHLPEAFPSMLHNVSRKASFADSIRQNIYAGGDSCGRSIMLGAILAACHADDAARGVPIEWAERFSELARVDSDVLALLA